MDYRYSVDIAASPDTIWPVLTDVANWPQWTASTRSVRPLEAGPLAEGSRVRVRPPQLPALVWQVTELTAPTHFAWRASSVGVTTTGQSCGRSRFGNLLTTVS
jgi:hypothetical protein